MKLNSILLIILITLNHGCFNDMDVMEEEVQMGSFPQTCQLNAERLKLILEENIQQDIHCLELNLEQFAGFVKRKDDKYINKNELSKFITKFFKQDSEAIIKSLDLLFDLNYLLLKGQKEDLTISKLPKLFAIFNTINEHGIPIKVIFDRINNGESYLEYRDAISALTNKASEEISEILSTIEGPDNSLNIISIVKSVAQDNNPPIDYELLKSLLSFKKLFLGGNKEIISNSEILNILSNLEEIVGVGLDLIHINEFNLEAMEDLTLFAFNKVQSIRDLLFQLDQDEVIFGHDDLISIGQKVLSSLKVDINLKNLEESIIHLKTNIIRGSPEEYSFADINTLFDFAEELIGRFYFNEVTFDYYKETLEKNEKIGRLTRPNLSKYDILPRSVVYRNWKEFNYIISNYRFFLNEDGRQYYTNEYRRTSFGLNIQTLLRWGFNKILKVYGHPKIDPDTGNYLFHVIEPSELREVASQMEGLLRELGSWPRFFNKFAEEATNSSDLFQYQSDGDGYININEATEYVSNIINGSGIAKEVFDIMPEYCDVLEKEIVGFDVTCYRKYLFYILFERLNYKNHYQKLYDYYIFYTQDELDKYLKNVETGTREIADDDIPMGVVDLSRLLISMSNIESTFIRYDNNLNNILDRDELDIGFPVFKKIIMEFGGLKKTQESLAISTFLYIVKYMDVPTPVKLIAFHVFGRKKNIAAKRVNVATILAIISQASQ